MFAGFSNVDAASPVRDIPVPSGNFISPLEQIHKLRYDEPITQGFEDMPPFFLGKRIDPFLAASATLPAQRSRSGSTASSHSTQSAGSGGNSVLSGLQGLLNHAGSRRKRSLVKKSIETSDCGDTDADAASEDNDNRPGRQTSKDIIHKAAIQARPLPAPVDGKPGRTLSDVLASLPPPDTLSNAEIAAMQKEADGVDGNDHDDVDERPPPEPPTRRRVSADAVTSSSSDFAAYHEGPSEENTYEAPVSATLHQSSRDADVFLDSDNDDCDLPAEEKVVKLHAKVHFLSSWQTHAATRFNGLVLLLFNPPPPS